MVLEDDLTQLGAVRNMLYGIHFTMFGLFGIAVTDSLITFGAAGLVVLGFYFTGRGFSAYSP
ncbi:hypothetical protein [Haladaptatus caseinilyticus]|uniref:hypothetical protein n=1 Tax=Haladaptatus caseinilyticus TaxID=2993314 RepID=UPI00224B9830|nr:hypothetical protein [Haladaptatus caseinilyticus]